MDWLLVSFVAVPVSASLLVLALGAAVRRAPRFDFEAEAAAALAGLRRLERSGSFADPGAGHPHA